MKIILAKGRNCLHFFVTLPFFILFLLLAGNTNGQPGSWAWAKSGGGSSSGDGVLVGTDAGGNVYIAGNYGSSTLTLGSFVLTNTGSIANVFVAKLDPNGNVLWAHTSVCNNDATVNGMATDAAGNVYLGGDFDAQWITNGTVTFGNTTLTSNGDYNAFIVKYNTSGDVVWAEGCGGPKNQVQAVAVDLTGNVFFSGIYTENNCTVGNITLTPDGDNDSFVAKLDSNGNALWAQRAAGTSWDDVYGMGVDASDNVYISGYSGSPTITFGTVTMSNSPYAIFLAKFDGSGNCKWATTSNSPGTNINWNTAMAVDMNGNSYLTGYVAGAINFGNSVTLTTVPGYDYFLAKYDTNGNAVWAQTAGGSAGATGYSVATDKAGNIYTTGYFNGPSVTFGDSVLTSSESQSCFLVEYDPNGSVTFAFNPVGTQYDNGEGVAVDASGDIMLSGSSSSDSLIFGSHSVACNDEVDVFIAEYKRTSSAGPTANFIASTTSVCIGSAVNFSDESTGSPTIWSWTFAGGTPNRSTSQTPSVVYDTAGTFSVKLVASNSSGADSITKTSYITVVASPVAGTLSAFPDSVCAGDSSQLTATGGSRGNLQWQSSLSGNNFTNIASADSSHYTTSPLSQTTYYRLIAMNGICADTSAAIPVVVNPNPAPPALSTSDSLICPSDSTLITTTPGNSSYLWNNGDTRFFTYADAAGGYWVTVTNTYGCSAISGPQNISVFPVPSVSIIAQGDTLSSFGAVSYQWYFDDSIIPGATLPVYMVQKTGNYAVQVADTNGCTALSSNTQVTVTGIAEPDAGETLNIYPNPFTNTIIVSASNTGITRTEIYDALGRMVYNKAGENPYNTMLITDVSSLLPGAYYVVVKTTGAEIYYRQMIKL